MLNGLPWKWTKIIISFLRLHANTAFWTLLLTMRATPFLILAHSSGYNWSFELNLPIPVHFSSLIPKLSVFTLAISCLTISNLPGLIDLTFQVPMQYCTAPDSTFTISMRAKSLQWCLTLCDPMDCSLPGSLGKNTGLGCHALLQVSSQPRDWTDISHSLLHWQAGSFTLLPPGHQIHPELSKVSSLA